MKKEFTTTGEALKFLIQLNNGQIFLTNQSIYLDNEPDHLHQLRFESKTPTHIYDYVINEYKYKAVLVLRETYLHPMITAAENDDINMFISSFDDRESTIGLAVYRAVENNSFKVIQYLVNEYSLERSVAHDAINNNKPEILKYLLENNKKLCYSWAARSLYKDSLDSLKVIIQHDYHKICPKEEYGGDWLEKELVKNRNKSAEYLRQLISKGEFDFNF